MVNKYKINFFNKRGKPLNFQKTFSLYWSSDKFVSKSVKSLNQIFLVTEYWLKAL